ncbi:protein KRE1 [Kluyveromyces marxianus]|uniref:Protein KRE1 n=2 Tax=Kluyveromyces marxianus TaxID=4911 RepID=W0TH48_KLUMD|nr:protein KRE1 [Kluyveromyces marxianus DMKU3-1042]QGN17965.1 protein KRE1 [Kluyveromyces marxianus]BAO42705.1 protein KRE1 [Kluyveromyces marxianus DMKU3-1042]
MRNNVLVSLVALLAACAWVQAVPVTTTFFSVNPNGATITLVSVFDPATLPGAALANTATTATTATTPATPGKPATTPTTTATTATPATPATTPTTTTTPGVAAAGVTTDTTTDTDVTPKTPAAGAATDTNTDTDAAATTTPPAAAAAVTPTTDTDEAQATAKPATGTRPDPSTSRTPLNPDVTSAEPIDTYVTLTYGTTKTVTSKRQPTSGMWVTITKNGRTTAVQTTWIQKFSSQYSKLAEPSSGSVGMGTLSGSVGIVKPKIESTISSAEAFVFRPATSFTSALITFLMLFI